MNQVAIGIDRYMGTVGFDHDLSTETGFRKIIGQVPIDNKLLHPLNKLGFRFADSTPDRSVVLMAVKVVDDLGLPPNASHNEIIKRGKELGLTTCPAETPFQLMMNIVEDRFVGALIYDCYMFATDAIRPKTGGKGAYVWTLFAHNDRVLLDATVYDSPDQKKHHEPGVYIFMFPVAKSG